MIRKLMILTLIVLLGYIFYGEFIADSLEPILQKAAKKPLFYQIRDPKAVFEDPSQEHPAVVPGATLASPAQGASGAPQEDAVAAQPPLEQPAANITQGQAQ